MLGAMFATNGAPGLNTLRMGGGHLTLPLGSAEAKRRSLGSATGDANGGRPCRA